MIEGQDTVVKILHLSHQYRGADKLLARPGRKQAAPVKPVMGRGMD